MGPPQLQERPLWGLLVGSPGGILWNQRQMACPPYYWGEGPRTFDQRNLGHWEEEEALRGVPCLREGAQEAQGRIVRRHQVVLMGKEAFRMGEGALIRIGLLAVVALLQNSEPREDLPWKGEGPLTGGQWMGDLPWMEEHPPLAAHPLKEEDPLTGAQPQELMVLEFLQPKKKIGRLHGELRELQNSEALLPVALRIQTEVHHMAQAEMVEVVVRNLIQEGLQVRHNFLGQGVDSIEDIVTSFFFIYLVVVG